MPFLGHFTKWVYVPVLPHQNNQSEKPCEIQTLAPTSTIREQTRQQHERCTGTHNQRKQDSATTQGHNPSESLPKERQTLLSMQHNWKWQKRQNCWQTTLIASQSLMKVDFWLGTKQCVTRARGCMLELFLVHHWSPLSSAPPVIIYSNYTATNKNGPRTVDWHDEDVNRRAWRARGGCMMSKTLADVIILTRLAHTSTTNNTRQQPWLRHYWVLIPP